MKIANLLSGRLTAEGRGPGSGVTSGRVRLTLHIAMPLAHLEQIVDFFKCLLERLFARQVLGEPLFEILLNDIGAFQTLQLVANHVQLLLEGLALGGESPRLVGMAVTSRLPLISNIAEFVDKVCGSVRYLRLPLHNELVRFIVTLALHLAVGALHAKLRQRSVLDVIEACLNELFSFSPTLDKINLMVCVLRSAATVRDVNERAHGVPDELSQQLRPIAVFIF